MAKRFIIVVPANKQSVANLDADKVNTGKDQRTFTVGLSASGNLPASHFWCSWLMSDKEIEKLDEDFDTTQAVPRGLANRAYKAVVNLFKSNKHSAKVFDASAWTPEDVLKNLGLKRIGMKI